MNLVDVADPTEQNSQLNEPDGNFVVFNVRNLYAQNDYDAERPNFEEKTNFREDFCHW